MQLLVDLGEVPLDRLGADEQRVGDLLIGSALCDQRGDLGLGRRQPRALWAPAAELGELRTGLLGPQPRAQLLEPGQRRTQRLLRRPPLFGPSLQRAERQQCPAAFERRR